MELINFLSFRPLDTLRSEMKAPLIKPIFIHKIKNRCLNEIRSIDKEGIEIESLDTLTIHADGTLIYQNTRVFLYILDNSFNGVETAEFHVSSCPTLQELTTRGRIVKYFISTREDGIFFVDKVDEHAVHTGIERPLQVCKNCLTFLNWSEYADKENTVKQKIFDDFTLPAFFQKYPKSVVLPKDAE